MLKKILPLAVKLAIAAVIVWLLIKWNSDGKLLSVFSKVHPAWMAAALFFYGTHVFANAWRWHLLLKAQNIDCSLADACSLTMQSFFFSLVIPGGAIGGDLVRVGFLTARVPKGQKFDGAFTILMDRFTGMIGIFMLALMILPFCLKYLETTSKVTEYLIWMLVLGALAGLCAAVVVFCHRKIEHFSLYVKIRSLADRVTHGMFSKLTDALDKYEHCKKEITVCIAASVVFVNVNLGVVMYCVCRGIEHAWNVPTSALGAITIGNIAGLLPLTPSGFGARDYFVIPILERGGMASDAALAASLSMTAIILLYSLAGGLFFLFSKHRRINILAATTNKHKIREFRELMHGTDGVINIVTPDDVPGLPDVVEDGATFEENSMKKAVGYSKASGMAAFADDSGLAVDALGGAPGIYSSRYTGENATDAQRIEKLLRELKDASDRTARFVCVVSIAENGKPLASFRGEVAGRIIDSPRGNDGFGYDPVFVPDGYDRTFAELAPEEKDSISHRGKAMRRAAEFMRRYFVDGEKKDAIK